MSERTFYERPVEVHGFKYIRLKSGRMITFSECLDAAEKVHTDMVRAVSRAFKTARDDDDLERIEWFIDGLEDYTAALRKHIDKQRGNLPVRERIKQLREISGRTPEEAEAFLNKAAKLERELDDS